MSPKVLQSEHAHSKGCVLAKIMGVFDPQLVQVRERPFWMRMLRLGSLENAGNSRFNLRRPFPVWWVITPFRLVKYYLWHDLQVESEAWICDRTANLTQVAILPVQVLTIRGLWGGDLRCSTLQLWLVIVSASISVLGCILAYVQCMPALELCV